MDPTLIIPVDNANASLRVLQITDCHIGPDDTETLLGLNTNESLHDVINHIATHEKPFDALLATGDISNNGGAKTYRRFLSIIENCAIPHRGFAWLPGNHDSPVDMAEAQHCEHLTRAVQLGKWLLILLNTQVPGHTHGNLRDTELDFLDDALLHNRDKHIIIFMHHQPVPVGSTWVDTQQVRSEYAFFKIIDQYRNVRAVVWGHVHQDFYAQRKGVHLLATPSTCIQFKKGSKDFAIDNLMPGYRWFELHGDGSFDTQVERITKKKYPIDFASNGY